MQSFYTSPFILIAIRDIALHFDCVTTIWVISLYDQNLKVIFILCWPAIDFLKDNM